MDLKTKYKAKKIKAVFFDIDDTLRNVKTGYLPASIERVFAGLKAKGMVTGIASGRAIYGVVPEIRTLQPDYFVTINGAYVLDKNDQEVYAEPMPLDLVERYVAWAEKEGIAYGFAGKDQPAVSERSSRVDTALVPIYGEAQVAADLYKNQPVYHMWTFAENEANLVLPDDLAAELRLVRWHPYSSDVVQQGMSKATGLTKLLAQIGLKPEEVLFFGDGPNDMEMFDMVGLKIAMGNAVPELKAKADFVTKPLEEDGILYALEELGMIEKEYTYPQTQLDTVEGPVATIRTNYGNLTLKLFPEQAPKTVANFVGHAKNGYYDGVIFHRIIPNFMIQGGDPEGTGMGGESIYGGSFEDEFSLELFHVRGALSMANAGPNTNGSQFFIVQNPTLPYAKKELERAGFPAIIADRYADQGGTPHLDQRHTVFGHLMDAASYEVLDAIAKVATDASDRPLEDVVIAGIDIED